MNASNIWLSVIASFLLICSQPSAALLAAQDPPVEAPVAAIPVSCTGVNQLLGKAASVQLGGIGYYGAALDHQLPGRKRGNIVDPVTNEVYYGTLLAVFEREFGQTMHVKLYPEAYVSSTTLYLSGPNAMSNSDPFLQQSDLDNCTPKLLGYLWGVFSHEVLHAKCAPHGVAPEDLDPAEADAYNRCSALNYRIQTAKAMCDMISIIDSQACQPPIKDGGDPEMDIEGLDTMEDVAEFCLAIQSRHDSLQESNNTPAAAALAYSCACGTPPWTPGDLYPDCPTITTPLDCTSVATAYPNDMVIPECPVTCSTCF